MIAFLKHSRLLLVTLLMSLILAGVSAFADDKDFPAKPNPPRLVNDYAGVMSGGQAAELERKLVEFDRTTSTQITIVVIRNLGERDVQEYSLELFNRWGIGQAGKENGVLLFASIEDRKAWITVGRGLQQVLTDAKSGQIFRNEIVPSFRDKNYYEGLSKASDAIIAVTKGEYKGDEHHYGKKAKKTPLAGIIILVIFIAFVVKMMGRGGGGGGGSYMSGRGMGDIATGMLLGSLLGGGRRGGGGWGSGGSDWGGGGGGFGGFGGGSSDGGGAGGSW
jgi:uncharacterized protein